MNDQRAALEAAIDDDPDDVRAYEVYADYLQEHGDPRGELIALSIAADTNRGITRAEQAYLDANQAVLLPPTWLASIRDLWATLGGSVWRWGCFQRARVGKAGEAVLVESLEHPAGRFLVELEIEHGIDMRLAVDALARAPRHALRRLSIGAPGRDRDAARRASIDVDLGSIWRALPRLEHLAIAGVGAQLGKLALPSLRELHIDSIALADADVIALERAQLPELEHLALGIGSQPAQSALVQRIVDGTQFLALRELSLTRSRTTADLLEILARSPLLRKLERLSLRGGALDDAGAALLARRADAFAHVAVDLNFNRLGYAGRNALAHLRNVETLFQKLSDNDDDDGD